MSRRGLAIGALLSIALAGAGNLFAQRSRITAINPARTVALAGHVHPGANSASERGRAPAGLPLDPLTLLFSPSAQQQADLDGLLARQQDPASPDYHRFLTPEEFADRFGLSAADIAATCAWLESQGFTVVSVARSRNSLIFSGTAGQVERAFHTEIHHYLSDGELRYANSTDPAIPASLSGVVSAIRGLHNFRLKPRARAMVTPIAAPRANPQFTGGTSGIPAVCAPNYTGHQLAPDDVATIYNIKPLYAQGIDGSGQKVVIVGQTQIILSELQKFRACFNLPANDPQLLLVPGLPDPGISAGDLGESELDLESVAAVARKATVIFVYSANVDDAVTYAISNNLAPVMSESYGLCELSIGSSLSNSHRLQAQQANLQGITWVAASGDNGAADCYSSGSRTQAPLAVDEPGSIPEVTSVGGTEFNEGSGNYWNATNDANLASALSWIPEMAWNDSVADGSPAAGGGGASSYFAKPAWQTGPGVPNDGARDVPDISLASSANHDGFMIYSSDGVPSAQMQIYGGTSVAAPVFGGMLTLLNQFQVVNGLQKTAGLGNVNPHMYAMAAGGSNAFHDVTIGSNSVNPCSPKARNCISTPIGYSAGPGYDQATGLGSLDAYNFITSWSQTTKTAATLTVNSSATSVSRTGGFTLTATVTGSGSVTPTGTVTWSYAGTTLGTAALAGSAGRATSTLTVQGSALPAGTDSLSASYSGDTNYLTASNALTVQVGLVLPTLAVSSSPSTIAQTGSVVLTTTVTAPGTLTPTGNVIWTFGTAQLGSSALTGSAGKATATLTVQGTQLPTGSPLLLAAYAGDSNYGPAGGSLNLTVTASAPVVTGVVNAASGAVATPQAVTPGSYVAIYGSGLSTLSPEINSQIPIPTTLGGVQVRLNGVAMPLSYVSSGQINALVPQNLTANTSYPLTLVRGSTTTSLGNLGIAGIQPGIYTSNASGSGQGIVEIAGTTLLAGPLANGFAPARRGVDFLQIFCTGLGPVTGPNGQAAPADGAAASSTILFQTTAKVTVTVGGINAPVTFAGLTPTLVSLYQVNVQAPAGAPVGSAVSVVVTVTDPVSGALIKSNTVTVALQ